MLLLLAALAYADIVPDDYIETCTLERYTATGAACAVCRSSVFDEAMSADCAMLASQGLTRMCQTAGATVWSEVWCRGEVVPVARPRALGRALGEGGRGDIWLLILGSALTGLWLSRRPAARLAGQ